MSKFKVGDKVFHVGNGVGKVVRNDKLNTDYDIGVEFAGHGQVGFCHDGKYHNHHKIPQLYTLEEARKMGFEVPKQKLKKTINLWVNVYSDRLGPSIYESEEIAKNNSSNAITCVKLTGEYEVEE